MILDRDACDRALDARDRRFDGVFFVGIRSTGIYCRPICPARRTLRKNRRYFTTAAAAERAGFRPCLRCRPELAPGRARIDAVPRVAMAAAQRIAAGALNEAGLDALAHDLQVSTRQLRRAMQQELGVSPVELAQTHRLLLAKQLLAETSLSASQVAFASGFSSVRRFNAAFHDRYRLNPISLRRSSPSPFRETNDFLRIALAYRPPLNAEALLAFLRARATPGVEVVTADSYERSLRIGDRVGVVRVSFAPNERRASDFTVSLGVSPALAPALMTVAARTRHLLDLDAEPETIAQHLRRSAFHSVATIRQGLRVPGTFDGFELAVRAILGQQVSVKGATTLMGRLVQQFGEPLKQPLGALTHLTPTAERIARASLPELQSIGLTAARAQTILTLAHNVAADTLRLEPDANVSTLSKQLMALPGIGAWTTEYIMMRACHWPDAFPASDLWLRRAAGVTTASQLLRLAEPWRPWRAYAALNLWQKPVT